MAAIRKTPTPDNGGSDVGTDFTRLLDAEIEALWRLAPEYLDNVAGSANAIIATSDATLVSAVLSLQRAKSFWLKPIANNTDAVTIEIDALPPVAIVDGDGVALTPNALVAARWHLLVFDGASLRVMFGGGGGSTVASDNLVNNGRLSPASGIFVPTVAVPSATSLFWTAGGKGNHISLYDGVSAWTTIASAEKSIPITTSQAGTTHSGTRIIDGLSDTSQLVAGMVISGTGVGGGAVISSVDSPTQVTSSVNGTASATNSITFKLPKNTGFDVYGKSVSSALKLFLVPRAALFTATANSLQDGILVKSTDASMRWLGWFKTGNTDGQIDYEFSGQYRFPIYNQDNRVYRGHCEPFIVSGTWSKSPCTTRVKADVGGAAGGTTDAVSPGGNGGGSAFGAWAIGGGGLGAPIASGVYAANGSGSSGDANYVGLGAPARATAGYGGRSIRTVLADLLGATEAVTVGVGGSAPAGQSAGYNGFVVVDEVLEI